MAEISTIQSILDALVTTQAASSNLTRPVEDRPTVASATPTAAPDDDTRPSHSYLDLIVMALLTMPQRQGNLHEIYRFISGKFTFYTKNRKHWKNSVRHNLALHKCFQRLDTDADQTPAAGKGKKPKPCPLWVLLWNPADRPGSSLSRKRQLNKTRCAKAKKSPPSKKAKDTPTTTFDLSDIGKLSSPDGLTRIAMMLPKIEQGDAVPPSSVHQGLVQPPLTPESDYDSLFSDHSPFLPRPPVSGSDGSGAFEYPPCTPSLPDQDPRHFAQLPLLSVEDICSVLQCDDCPPGSPDSGTGADLLDGFGIFEPTALLPEHQQYEHTTPCHGHSQLPDNPHQATDSYHHDLPTFSFLVPKCPVERPLSVDTECSW